MSEESLVQTMIDAARYYGEGTFATFDRIAARAFEYFGLTPSPDQRRYMRNTALKYARYCGHIEYRNKQDATYWSASKTSLIEMPQGDYVLLADSSAKDRAEKLAGPGNAVYIPASPAFVEYTGGLPFYPATLHLKVNATEARSIAEKLSLGFSTQFQNRLFSLLPSLSDLEPLLLAEVPTGSALTLAESVHLYDFSRAEWVPAEQRNQPGLHRIVRKRPHGVDYMIVVPRRRGNAYFRVLEQEWQHVLALKLSSQRLPLTYSKEHSELQVPKGLVLPTVIERALYSGSLSSPHFSREGRTYSGIAEENVWRLGGALPLFKIQISGAKCA